jgi:hypothetical protein
MYIIPAVHSTERGWCRSQQGWSAEGLHPSYPVMKALFQTNLEKPLLLVQMFNQAFTL